LGRGQKPVGKRILLFVVRTIGRPLVWALGRVSWDRAESIGGAIGGLAYHVSRRYREVAISNLMAAFPDLTRREAESMAKATFRNFFRAFIEFFVIERMTPEEIKRIVDLKGTEYTDEALRQGKGALLITAHIGNWEACARRMAVHGYPLSVIARDSDDPTMTGVVNRIRQGAGYKVLSRDESVRAALRLLRANELLGILPDQNTLGKCVFVNFFGRPAATAAGVAMFALKSGSPVLPAFSSWNKKTRRYSAVIYPPLEIALTGDTERDVEAITTAYTAAIEAEIRKSPTEWLWLHNRWKRAHEAPSASKVESLRSA
jgi:Kdo2-lipid IVA lauroyltransferase/acyltransferase